MEALGDIQYIRNGADYCLSQLVNEMNAEIYLAKYGKVPGGDSND